MRLLLTVILLCVTLTACVTTQTQDNGYLPMPEEFLGYWLHEKNQFRMTVNPDGTITNIYIKENQLIDEYQYKVLHVYNSERVAVLFKNKAYYGDYYGEWREPKFAFFWMHYPEFYPDVFDPAFYWGGHCRIISENEWADPILHQQAILNRLKTLHSQNPCISGSTSHRLRAIDKSKFD